MTFGKRYLENYFSINISDLVRASDMELSRTKTNTLRWVNIENSYVRFRYNLSSDKSMSYKVKLSYTNPHYGGKRFWFICPVTNHRVKKLFLLNKEGFFVSRKQSGILYASQGKDKIDRAIAKKWKIFDRIGGDFNIPVRPKGMHHKTYIKYLTAYRKQEELCESLLLELSRK